MIENITISTCPIREIDAEEWNQFLKNISDSTFFCTTDWWYTYDDSFILQVRDKENKLIAGVPFRYVSVLPIVGRFFKFSWLDSSILVDKQFSDADTMWVKKKAFSFLLDYLKKSQVVVMFISTKTRSHDGAIFKEVFNHTDRCATFIVDLTKSEEDLVKSFARRRRRSIKKAQEIGVEVRIKEGKSGYSLIQDYCVLQDALFKHKSGSYSSIHAKSESYIKSILSSSDKTYIAMAYYNNQPVAGRILVSHRDILHDYLAASDLSLNRTTNASSLLQYDIIKFGKNKGYQRFDFGGIPTSIPDVSNDLHGVYMFKKEFGGEKYEYDCCNYAIRKYRYLFVWWLRKYSNNSLGIKIYKILKRKHTS
jgi:lipid II:glycine glycyltransferase (peptidoglycan interpeptide bridge formation enzyme)